jgi:ribosomal protein S20
MTYPASNENKDSTAPSYTEAYPQLDKVKHVTIHHDNRIIHEKSNAEGYINGLMFMLGVGVGAIGAVSIARLNK